MCRNIFFLQCIFLESIYFVNPQNQYDKNTFDICPKDVNNIWNKTTMTAFQLNDNVCHQTCYFSLLFLHRDNDCFDACCFPCDCERPRCEIYGICCPGALREQQEEQTASMFDSKRKRLTCSGITEQHNLAIRSCPSNYRNDTVRNQCETENVDPSNIVEVNTQVSDSKTGVTYFNVYCAICNNITEFDVWTFSITCATYLKVYKAKTELELFKLSLQKNSSCYLQDVLKKKQFLSCDLRFFNYSAPFLDSCNITGKWLNYDMDIEYNCLTSSYDFSRLIHVNEILFKNVFCAICNLDSPPKIKCYQHIGKKEEQNPIYLPFTLLLNFGNIVPTNRDLETQFLDCNNDPISQLECPIIQCSDGKIYSKNECVTPLSGISGLGYKLQLVYEYQSLKLINSNYFEWINKKYFIDGSLRNVLSSLELWLSNSLVHWAEQTDMEISIRHTKPYHKIMDCCLLNISGEYKMKPNIDLITLFRKVLDFSLFYFDVHFIALKRTGRDEIENFFSQVLAPGEIKILLNGINLKLKYVLGDVKDLIKDTVDCVDANACLITEHKVLDINDSKTIWLIKDQFLTLTPVLTCAHVSYNQNHFKVERIDPERPWRKQITLSLGETNLQFNKHKELAKLAIEKNNTLKICVDLLKNKIAQLLYIKHNSSIIIYQYILTLFCLSISISCLLITLVVYLTFSILRNIPGLHNICLSASLLLSQVLLLASSHVSGPSVFCTGLGILTHFMWLNTFCWSFFCCLTMYSVFKAKNRIQLSHDDKKKFFFKRLVLAVMFPATVVSCVIVYDFLSSDGKRMGYGHISCYLNSANLIIYSMGIPIACVLVCNMYFFLSSVYKIYKVKQLQSNVSFRIEERKQMCVYIKLSTMTGVFWFVAILSEALDSDPLRFLAIVLNGLQGFFIFVSYICNKKILTLCLQLFYQFKPQKDDPTTEQDNTVTT